MNYYDNESALMSALMTVGTTPEAIDILGKIESDMFECGSFGVMFNAVVDLYSKGMDFDFISVAEKADFKVADITEMVKCDGGRQSNIKLYAKKVRQGHYLRKAKAEFEKIVNSIDNCSDDSMIGELHSMVEAAVSNLVVETDTKRPRSAKEIAEQYVDIINERYEGGETEARIMTGIPAIDDHTLGFNKSDLIVLAGAPSMGKTELMTKIVNGSSCSEGGALVFSMEMDEFQLIERSIAIEGNIPLSCARNPRGMTQDEWGFFSKGMGDVKAKDFYVLDQGGLSVDEICAQSREHKRNHPGMKMICIDYIGLIPVGKGDRHDLLMGEISRKLKLLAKELKTPVLLLAQITSKQVENRPNKRPMGSDIKDSSRIQDDADWIIFPYRDEHYFDDTPLKGVSEIIFGKARHAEKKTVYMGWEKGHFTNIEQHEGDNKYRLATSKPEMPSREKKNF